MKPSNIVVIGAGPAGLHAARLLAQAGKTVTVLEREATVGGLAATLERNGNFYGHGFHSFHDPDFAFVDEHRNLTGPIWRSFDRDVCIKLQGRFFSYPLDAMGLLGGLPLGVIGPCLAGFVAALARSPFHRTLPSSAEEAIVRLYGKVIYRHMFEDYTKRFWGTDPALISAAFVEARLPRLVPVERLKRVLAKFGWRDPHIQARLTEIGRSQMHTTRRGAGGVFEAVARSAEAAGCVIRTGVEVTGLEIESGRVAGVELKAKNGIERMACGAVVSTMPIFQLIKRLRPAPPEAVLASAQRLRNLGVVTAGFLVRRDRVLPGMMTYFPGRSFHRLSEPKTCGIDVCPKGSTVLLAETTCSPSDPVWQDPNSLLEDIVRDLEAEGLIAASDIQESHVFQAADAYPMYALGFEKNLAVVRGYIAGIGGLVSTGRQGRFAFLRSAEAMKKAWEDVQRAGL